MSVERYMLNLVW